MKPIHIALLLASCTDPSDQTTTEGDQQPPSSSAAAGTDQPARVLLGTEVSISHGCEDNEAVFFACTLRDNKGQVSLCNSAENGGTHSPMIRILWEAGQEIRWPPEPSMPEDALAITEAGSSMTTTRTIGFVAGGTSYEVQSQATKDMVSYVLVETPAEGEPKTTPCTGPVHDQLAALIDRNDAADEPSIPSTEDAADQPEEAERQAEQQPDSVPAGTLSEPNSLDAPPHCQVKTTVVPVPPTMM